MGAPLITKDLEMASKECKKSLSHCFLTFPIEVCKFFDAFTAGARPRIQDCMLNRGLLLMTM